MSRAVEFEIRDDLPTKGQVVYSRAHQLLEPELPATLDENGRKAVLRLMEQAHELGHYLAQQEVRERMGLE